ncbi:hypothetical protein VTN77DRAFT_4414 [Rasamsonia byssochlamydoides]|uniref:uncharacterized protein n=1 Tax=Rasamsonia byssochlamydoides TaxID=89139 RepID=UPI003743472B
MASLRKSCLALAGLAIITAVAASSSPYSYVNYSTVTGYFLQDLDSTDADTFDYTAVNFGLLNRTYDADRLDPFSNRLTQWERFYRQVVYLNEISPANVEYKVLFMGRHGEGWHNAAEDYYGTPAWNCYWAELDGNGTASWSDARLTDNGIAQAQTAHNFWQKEIDEQRIHTPDSYFVSPLFCTLQTAQITFSGLRLPAGAAKFVPLIVEKLRENISIHTCDRRSNRTVIHDAFPDWPIEPGFTECDELWNGVTGETDSSEAVRSLEVLDQIFAKEEGKDNGLFISITSHSGEIGSILSVLGHQPFSLNTGAVIPVLVKAETIYRPSPTTSTQPWTTSPHCTVPPVTSVSACLCPSSAAPVTTPLVPTSGCN